MLLIICMIYLMYKMNNKKKYKGYIYEWNGTLHYTTRKNVVNVAQYKLNGHFVRTVYSWTKSGLYDKMARICIELDGKIFNTYIKKIV